MSDDTASASQIPEEDPGIVRMEQVLTDLGEFFDSVHVVATRRDHDSKGGFTDIVSRGVGNSHARYGSLKDTVVKLEEHMRIVMRKANE